MVLILLQLLTLPIKKFLLIPFTNRISDAVDSLGGASKRIIGGLWRLPGSVWMVLILSLLLKAYLIYEWICGNIRYDRDKAEKIVTDPGVVALGSVVAYSERKGVCFDYSTLYVSMCRAVGLKVRLVTGLGYNGALWGDHAWNLGIQKNKDGSTSIRPLGVRDMLPLTAQTSP